MIGAPAQLGNATRAPNDLHRGSEGPAPLVPVSTRYAPALGLRYQLLTGYEVQRIRRDVPTALMQQLQDVTRSARLQASFDEYDLLRS